MKQFSFIAGRARKKRILAMLLALVLVFIFMSSLSVSASDVYPYEVEVVAVDPENPAGPAPTTVRPNDTLILKVTVTSTGAFNPSIGVTLFSTVAGQVSVDEYGSAIDGPWHAWDGAYLLGNFSDDNTLTFWLKCNVDPTAAEAVSVTLTINDPSVELPPWETIAPPADGVTLSVRQIRIATTDLSVQLTSAEKNVYAGGGVEYSITASNEGDVADEAEILHTAPVGLENVRFSDDDGENWQTWTGSYPLVPFPNNSSQTLLFAADVVAAPPSSIVLSAAVSGLVDDQNRENDVAALTLNGIPVVALSAKMEFDGDVSNLTAGDNIGYTVTLLNAGPSLARSASFTHHIPLVFNDVELSTDNGATWNEWPNPNPENYNRVWLFPEYGNPFPAGAEHAVTLKVKAKISESASGTVNFKGWLSAFLSAHAGIGLPHGTHEADQDDNNFEQSLFIKPQSDLSVSVAASPQIVYVGKTVRYQIDVLNNGPGAAQAVQVSGTIPEGLSDAQYSIDNGNAWLNWTGSCALLEAIEVDSTAVVLVEAVANGDVLGSLNFTASASGNLVDNTDGNNTASATVSVRQSSSSPQIPTIIVQDPENGSVKASPQNPNRGDTVTITVTPDEGFLLESITLTDKNGEVIEVTDRGDGTFTFVYGGCPVTIDAVISLQTATPLPFTDVFEDDWFYGDVRYVYENKLFFGTSATQFSPNLPITRGMFVTVLGRMANASDTLDPSELPFIDVDPELYYAPYIAWAAKNGIVMGYDATTFGPEDSITREQAAAILERYITFAKIKVPTIDEYHVFADEDQISEYAKNAIQLMNALGVIQGIEGNRVDPQGKATRAQVAAMLHRFIENVVK